MDKLTSVLQQRFGYASFREGQKKIIEQVIAGKDVVAILPTGMGKSLLFQLPAYFVDGAVLIVSPLLSLMQDQVEQMKMIGEKRVVAINSFLSYEEKEMAFRHLTSYKFIFTSPEMLQNERFTRLLASIKIAYVVADEAHCISQWGFDFRPDYLRISKWLRSFPRPNILALTATATKKAVIDIKNVLQMNDPFEYTHSLDRPTIAYEVKQLDNQQEKIAWILGRVTSTEGPGIIYTQSRKKAESYAAFLREKGIKAAYYHAKMDQEDRILIQQQFQQGELEWICATNAFGMGIHKDNIRQIIHDHMPTSIASYMQEVGRAARDGKQSIASLIFTASDVEQAFYVSMQDFPEEADIKLIYANETHSIEIAETTMRIVNYWKEILTEQETIQLFSDIKQKKWKEINQLFTLFQNGKCIREQLLLNFDEQLVNRPTFCCSVCSFETEDILLKRSLRPVKNTFMDWEERLQEILL